MRRDRAQDGRFVVAVRTTGIYCRPSCPARRPRRDHVALLPDPASARSFGYRACLRCAPDGAAREETAVRAAVALLDAAEAPVALDRLAAHVGYAPHHFHRLFRRATGVTPAAYARALRGERAAAALDRDADVTAAIYAAGYATPSRFYDDAASRFGMAPRRWATGGAGETIGWAVTATALGPLAVAMTRRGPCHIAFDEDGDAIAARFPLATLRPAGPALSRRIAAAVASAEAGAETITAAAIAPCPLPSAAARTAFREAVRAALRCQTSMVRQM